jgi:hypothetical protein
VARFQIDNGAGSMPTSGSNRPGPMGPQPRTVAATGTNPVAIRLVRLGIDTNVETGEFAFGLPSDPSTPWIVAWYRNSALLGEPGVVLIGGKTTVDDAGPSAFTRLAEVVAGDIVELTGQNGGSFTYAIDTIESDAKTPAFDQVLAQNDQERLMLVGWDGKYPSQLSNRTVIVVTGTRTQ